MLVYIANYEKLFMWVVTISLKMMLCAAAMIFSAQKRHISFKNNIIAQESLRI